MRNAAVSSKFDISLATENITVCTNKVKLILVSTLLIFFLFPTYAVTQITINTALPVGEGKIIVRAQHKIIRATGDPTPMNRELFVQAFPVVGVYGVTGRFSAFGVLPLLHKSMAVTTVQRRIKRRSDFGLGDARLFVRYDAYRRNQPGRTFRIAPFGGLEIPTGSSKESDSFGRLPRALQPGSGSWDPFLGAVLTRQTLHWQLDISALYQANTENNNFEFGDEYRIDAAFKYRIYPRKLNGGVPGFGYINIESNLIRQDENEVNNKTKPDSGGTTWFVAPGLQYITKKFVFEAALQLPVVQNLNGNALENDFITTFSIRINI